MKKLGILLIALSLLIVFLAFNMDVVVGTTYNIGLLNERQNIVYLSGVLFLSGVMFFGFGFVAKEEAENIKAFALWTFLTPIVLLIGMKVVTDIQEANRQEEIQLQIAIAQKEQAAAAARQQEEIRLQAVAAQAKQAAILKENSDKFIANEDGTVTVKANGLMWQRCSVGQTWTGAACSGDAMNMTWDDAMKSTSNFAGHKDWRMPTKVELEGLVFCSDNKTKTLGKEEGGFICTGSSTSPTINTTYFPNTPSVWFWSSSPNAYVSYGAWYVYFGYGYSGSYGKGSGYGVRLVRG